MPINSFLYPAPSTPTFAYEVANSCRFNDDDSPRLSKTPGDGSRRKFTFSAWIKRGNLTGSNMCIFSPGHKSSSAGNDRLDISFHSTNGLRITQAVGGLHSSLDVRSSQLFRDVSAWFHIVVAVDTEQSTASDRVKMYSNGTQITDFATSTYPSLNADLKANNYSAVAYDFSVGGFTELGFFDGYMTEVFFIDGQQLAPSSFGEYNEDSPTIWQPKDCKDDLTFGTNGFYLDFEDSSNLGNDANGGTDLTEVNIAATDQATDTPTNNFATLNLLDNAQSDATYSEGNCKWATSTNSHYFWGRSTIGMSAGKWYMEFKATSIPEHGYFGICVDGPDDNTTFLTNGGRNDHVEYGYKTSDGNSYTNTGSSSYGDTYDDGDIIGVALDLTNNKLYFSKNGTWQNSGDPTSGATGTGAISITAAASNGFGEYFFCCADGTSGTSGTFEANFGNPTFSISSSQADDNGYGNFEYDVPAGYLALCTKNLGSDGG